MFAMMSPTPFALNNTLPPSLPTPPSASTTTTTPLPQKQKQKQKQTRYRPSISSPLSSSPIRASSYSPPASPPTSFPSNSNFGGFFPSQYQQPRDTQSSPIAQPTPSRKLFKFATSTPRPNPVVKKREEMRESRRRLFLKNVRERGDDRAWERRGGDQEVLRLEWSRLNNELRQQKEADLAVFGTDADIEEAVQLQEQSGHREESSIRQPGMGIDDMMVDAIAREEEAEIEALLSLMPNGDGDGDREMGDGEGRPESVYFSDEEDYDALFMELSQQDATEGMVLSQDTEMS
ncbi:hypothetical protein GE09DRAFT_1231453 [Coniochaeta sp. 2T2.1]|nr:hypothetical protein GE09DRAFT_1231453 [Coniochaeta sp. 2T2.1]